MGKTIADPLFLALVSVLFVQIVLYREWGRLRRAARVGLLILTVATAGLWLLGTHAAESFLIDRLSRVHPLPEAADIASVDVVVVLSGGFVDVRSVHASPGEIDRPHATAYDQPDAWSTARVVQGVRTFFASDARLLVVSGYWGGGGEGADSARLVEAMKGLAIDLGVPAESIVMEPDARTTRQHPPEVKGLGVVAPEETIAVVTSSWHLPRAMREFEKHFEHIVAVPAFDTAVDQKRGLLRWLPRSYSLTSSATAVAEYVGIIWYRNPLLR